MNSLLLFLLNVLDLDMFVARWSRFLDTTDVKGVKAQGEFWQREAVKTVRILAKLAEVTDTWCHHVSIKNSMGPTNGPLSKLLELLDTQV